MSKLDIPMKERRKAWTDALRSEKYEQGTGRLETEDGKFCCLGVACKVYQELGGEVGTSSGKLIGGSLEWQQEVQIWLGVEDVDGRFGNTTLAVENDAHGRSFTQIADLIDSEPEGLFVD